MATCPRCNGLGLAAHRHVHIAETIGLVRRGRGRDVPSMEDYARVGWADHAEAVQAHEDTAREMVISEHGRDAALLADWPAAWREIARRT